MHELSFCYPKLLMLEDKPHADDGTADFIRTHDCDTLIAVGSGTISDLCKYASFLDGKPYAVFLNRRVDERLPFKKRLDYRKWPQKKHCPRICPKAFSAT